MAFGKAKDPYGQSIYRKLSQQQNPFTDQPTATPAPPSWGVVEQPGAQPPKPGEHLSTTQIGDLAGGGFTGRAGSNPLPGSRGGSASEFFDPNRRIEIKDPQGKPIPSGGTSGYTPPEDSDPEWWRKVSPRDWQSPMPTLPGPLGSGGGGGSFQPGQPSSPTRPPGGFESQTAPAATLPTSYQSPYQSALSGALQQPTPTNTAAPPPETPAPTTPTSATPVPPTAAGAGPVKPGTLALFLSTAARRGGTTQRGNFNNITVQPGIAAAGGAIVGGGPGALLGTATSLAGGLWNMATGHAKGADMDFSIADAITAVKLAYREFLGREPSEAEVQSQLRGQGWDGKSGWVGQQGLASVLVSIQQSSESQNYDPNAPPVTPTATGDGTTPPPGDGAPPPPGAPAPNSGGGPAPSAGKGPDDPNSSRNAPRLIQVKNPDGTLGWALTEHGNTRRLQPNEVTAAKAYVEEFWKKFPSGFQPGVGPQTNEGYGDDPAKPSGGPGPNGEPAPGAAKPSAYRDQLIGFDATKFDDPTHNTPKYVFARIAAQFDVKDPAQRQQMLAALKADPSGYFKNATLSGSKGDKLVINGALDPKFEGISEFDIIYAAGEGGKGWTWQPLGGASGAPSDPTTPPSGSSPYEPNSPNTTYNSSMLNSNLVNDLLSRSIKGDINFGAPSGDTYSKQMLDYLMRQLALGGALR